MRPSRDRTFMDMAQAISMRGTCLRRQVGVVLVDEDGIILSTGHNGVPKNWPHCSEGYPCPGADAESGTNLDSCLANHSEINALIHCPDTRRICTVYSTASPCISCVKALLCTGAQRIVFRDEYPHGSMELWVRHPIVVRNLVGQVSGLIHRTWEQLKDGEDAANLLASSNMEKPRA